MMHVYEGYYVLPRRHKGFIYDKEIWDENSIETKRNLQ